MSGELTNISERLKVDRCRLWRLPTIVDMRGQVLVAELAAMPFPVRRVFFVSRVPGNESRGHHAHKSGEELLFAIKGSVAVTLDDGTRRADVVLQDPGLGLVIGPMVWCVQSRFSDDAILGAFASQPYDAGDYVRDYAGFRSMVAAS
jgi:WxcM-like protein